MAKAAKNKSDELQEIVPENPEIKSPEVATAPEVVVEETEEPDYKVEITPEPEPTSEVVEVAPEQKEIKESDEIGFLYTIIETMEYGGWGKALHPMIKSRIEYLRSK